ncbi:MAG: alpha-E domain-containing protein [Limimaricola soesokkakensis]|uniref:alpha-E domain-containing protein n=1 Tax=Limimaricola soesokkakensis TaxID=1343159 RepID=UPI004059573C
MTTLGKTAGGLYWMFRHLERSENTARMIEVGQRIALTRSSDDDEWGSILQAAATHAGYVAKHGDVTRDLALDWMLRDPDNPSSVLSVVKAARDNARVVRTALTREVWEAVNEAWMTLCAAMRRKVHDRDLQDVLALIRQRAAFVRGATHGTMLRNDIYDFCRLGMFSERADCTARILDVKYFVLLPSATAVGSRLDDVQWETILRSVSGVGAFQMRYGQQLRPREIAEFIIHDRAMPRSLAFCAHKLEENLGYLVSDYGTRLPSHEIAEKLNQRLLGRSIDTIFENGLHEFLMEVQHCLAHLSQQIEIDYRFYR